MIDMRKRTRYLLKRVQSLEGGSITVIAITPDGVEQKMDVNEMLRTHSEFKCINSGANLQDLDIILQTIGTVM